MASNYHTATIQNEHGIQRERRRCTADPTNPNGRGCKYGDTLPHFNTAQEADDWIEHQTKIDYTITETVETINTIPGHAAQTIINNDGTTTYQIAIWIGPNQPEPGTQPPTPNDWANPQQTTKHTPTQGYWRTATPYHNAFIRHATEHTSPTNAKATMLNQLNESRGRLTHENPLELFPPGSEIQNHRDEQRLAEIAADRTLADLADITDNHNIYATTTTGHDSGLTITLTDHNDNPLAMINIRKSNDPYMSSADTYQTISDKIHEAYPKITDNPNATANKMAVHYEYVRPPINPYK